MSTMGRREVKIPMKTGKTRREKEKKKDTGITGRKIINIKIESNKYHKRSTK